MLSYEEALDRLLRQIPATVAHSLPLERAGGHVLARQVCADRDLPPFPRSFMDGYALRSADLTCSPERLRVVGCSRAGVPARVRISAGETVQIMTGAPLPEGADAVQMVEKTRRLEPGWVEILEPVGPGDHVAPRGSEVRAGAPVLEAGRRLGPAELGVLATFGISAVEVFRRPRVLLIVTGDELVGVEEVPGPAQIRDSNGPMLSALCATLGLECRRLRVVADSMERTRAAIREGRGFDLVVLSGGVSMGEFDYVHKALVEEGAEVIFHKVAIKPGKPVMVARQGRTLFFALPGNPVSAFVDFHLFVRPAALRWAGHARNGLGRVMGRLRRGVTHKPGRRFYKPAVTVWEEGFQVEPLETAGSADLVAFSRANSLLVVDSDVERIKPGSQVPVLFLPPSGPGGELWT